MIGYKIAEANGWTSGTGGTRKQTRTPGQHAVDTLVGFGHVLHTCLIFLKRPSVSKALLLYDFANKDENLEGSILSPWNSSGPGWMDLAE